MEKLSTTRRQLKAGANAFRGDLDEVQLRVTDFQRGHDALLVAPLSQPEAFGRVLDRRSAELNRGPGGGDVVSRSLKVDPGAQLDPSAVCSGATDVGLRFTHPGARSAPFAEARCGTTEFRVGRIDDGTRLYR